MSDRVVVLAHRGGHGPHRENTLEAFAAALAAGADGVELDVRSSSDGVAVIHHDAVVPGAGPVHQLRRAELPAWVPTLAQSLEVCAGTFVDIEIKNSPGEDGYDPGERLAAQVADLVIHWQEEGGGPARMVVSSFFPASLEATRAAQPLVDVGLLVHPAFDALAVLDQAQALGASWLLPFHSMADPGLVGRAHETGLAVGVWTVNAPEDLAGVLAAGVDLVITDEPGATLAALAGSSSG